MSAKKITREEWLLKATAKLRPLIKKAGAEVGDVLVSVGFAKGRANAIGQCWSPQADRGVHQIFICPRLDNAYDALAVLAHELVHAAVGCECGHKGPFKTVARALGLEGKLTATVVPPDGELGQFLKKLEEQLGPYPHQKLMPRKKPARAAMGGWIRLQSITDEAYRVLISPKQLEENGFPLDPWGEPMEQVQ